MTTEERIADLERRAGAALGYAEDETLEEYTLQWAQVAIACELLALGLTIREEVREAAWRLGGRAMTGEQVGAFIRAMGEPRPYDQEAVPERLIEAVEGMDVP